MFTSFIAFLMVEMTALSMFRRDKELLLSNQTKASIYLIFILIHCAMCLLGCAIGALIKLITPISALSVILSSVIYIIVAAVYIRLAVKGNQMPIPKKINTTIVALQAILSGVYLLPVGVSSSLAGIYILYIVALSLALPAAIVYFGLGKYDTKIKTNMIVLAAITILSAVLDWIMSIV